MSHKKGCELRNRFKIICPLILINFFYVTNKYCWNLKDSLNFQNIQYWAEKDWNLLYSISLYFLEKRNFCKNYKICHKFAHPFSYNKIFK